MPVFVLDSHFFIQAHRLYYPIDVARGFWNKVHDLAKQGRMMSMDKVKAELYDKHDALEEWCKINLPKDFFKDTSVLTEAYERVATWAASRQEHYTAPALKEFLGGNEADAYLLAYCLASTHNRCVVTHELSEPKRRNKIKIPDVCIAFKAPFVNAMEMFRQWRETF